MLRSIGSHIVFGDELAPELVDKGKASLLDRPFQFRDAHVQFPGRFLQRTVLLRGFRLGRRLRRFQIKVSHGWVSSEDISRYNKHHTTAHHRGLVEEHRSAG